LKTIFILLLLLFTIVFFWIPTNSVQASTVTEITTSPALHRNPDIFKNTVVFDDRSSGRDEVSMYDIKTGKITQLTNSCSDQQHTPKIYGDNVVYVDRCNTSLYSQVFYYNIPTGKTFPVGTGEAEAPSIYKNNIIFAANPTQGANYNQIFLFKIGPGTTTQITHDNNSYLNSSIYENNIVFDGIPHGHHSNQIFLYNLKANTINQITNAVDFETDDSLPSIYEDKIVWEDHNVLTNNINTSLYDIPSGQVVNHIDENSVDTSPGIYGDNVVYEDNGSQAIVMYNIPSAQTSNVFAGTTTQFLPAIYQNTVVWVGVDPNTGYHEIYMFQ